MRNLHRADMNRVCHSRARSISWRRLYGTSFVLAFCCLAVMTGDVLAQDAAPSTANGVRSNVQASGVGIIKIKPTKIRISIPIRAMADSAWDAIEALRNSRTDIEERAIEMGALEGTTQVFGFTCGVAQPTSISIRGGSTAPKYTSSCFFIADFPIRNGQDIEETMGLSYAQLDQLTELLPEAVPVRRSYSISSISRVLTSQQLESPLVLYVAEVTPEQREEAFESALKTAKEQVQSALDAMGMEATSLSITQTPDYTSVRQTNPIETVLMRNKNREAVGVFADGVDFEVRLMVSGQFQQGK